LGLWFPCRKSAGSTTVTNDAPPELPHRSLFNRGGPLRFAGRFTEIFTVSLQKLHPEHWRGYLWRRQKHAAIHVLRTPMEFAVGTLAHVNLRGSVGSSARLGGSAPTFRRSSGGQPGAQKGKRTSSETRERDPLWLCNPPASSSSFTASRRTLYDNPAAATFISWQGHVSQHGFQPRIYARRTFTAASMSSGAGMWSDRYKICRRKRQSSSKLLKLKVGSSGRTRT